MPIIKTVFSKVCTKCGETFTPIGKYYKICDKCNSSNKNDSYWNRLRKLVRNKKCGGKKQKVLSNA